MNLLILIRVLESITGYTNFFMLWVKEFKLYKWNHKNQ